MSQKSYNGEPTLYLIPTPIGNLDDITYRAIQILSEVQVVFSEDTRVTAQLFNHFNISKKLVSNHNYNESKNINLCLKYLNEGYSVGLVSDRGTPIISDPGYTLAKAVMENGYNVVGLPGATALIPALINSGLDPKPFTFYGFLSQKVGKRKEELLNLKKLTHTIIFYESPHRIEQVLNEMLEIFGNRKISISREISKKFEQVYRGSIKDILTELETIKGEIVLIVEGNKEINSFDNLSIIEHVNLYIKEGHDKKEAMRLVSKERKMSKSEVYKEYLSDGEEVKICI